MWLTDFRPQRPTYVAEQAEGLMWLADAHAEAERHLATATTAENEVFSARIHKVMKRVACGPDRIARRGHELADFLHRDWAEMKVYRLTGGTPHGAGTAARMEAFEGLVTRIFDRAYPENATADGIPDHMVHVTCTGYVSPSGAQTLVTRRGWAAKTRVTHAYHMGCYASLPAVRQAMGLGHVLRADGQKSARIDLVHTELCTLHLDPGDHSPEQLVVQSLFADGSIRYSLVTGEDGQPPTGDRLEILTIDDVIAEGTDLSMTWRVGDHGMRMTLSREVPAQVGAAIDAFVARLAARAGTTVDALRREAIFAVHPGGPKIIDQVADKLGLAEEQVAHSRAVLRERGNMSSATLPHVWGEILGDARVAAGRMVVALAFGPGLTLAGGVFRVAR